MNDTLRRKVFISSLLDLIAVIQKHHLIVFAESGHFDHELHGSDKSYPQNGKRLHRRTEIKVVHAECI